MLEDLEPHLVASVAYDRLVVFFILLESHQIIHLGRQREVRCRLPSIRNICLTVAGRHDSPSRVRVWSSQLSFNKQGSFLFADGEAGYQEAAPIWHRGRSVVPSRLNSSQFSGRITAPPPVDRTTATRSRSLKILGLVVSECLFTVDLENLTDGPAKPLLKNKIACQRTRRSDSLGESASKRGLSSPHHSPARSSNDS